MSTIAERLGDIRRQIAAAANAARRPVEEITLVAVSKKQTVGAIREAYAAGQRDFGENYAQELVQKREELADLKELRWHFIGALQSNKARLVIPGSVLVHAVDRVSVAEALSKRAASAGIVAEILVEVNVGGEASKAGVSPDGLPELLATFATLPGLTCRGLMCIPPPGSPGTSFETLRQLRDRYRPRFHGLDWLSMGMTSDFPEAVAHGATHVRVGTAIFGARS